MTDLITYIMLLPLASSLTTYFLPNAVSKVTSTCFVAASAVLSVILFFTYQEPIFVELFQWMKVGNLDMIFGFYVDRITATMVTLVTIVSALVHMYSIGYMSRDPDIRRFMTTLSFFTFAMLILVTSSDLIQMFIGWEAVGLASYLLIGFWFQKGSANLAAQKAFLVNRVGDFCLLLGICIMVHAFSTSDVQEVIGISFGADQDLVNLICLLLVVGATSKSAQIFLHTWLPDAMEGPTPVSALIHSATMVTAGVFLLCRFSPIMESSTSVLQVVTLMGAVTAFYASTVAVAQNDIKKIIAYSTCSQIGFMFIAVGVSAYPAALFHLFTHGFFKALLFLCAGSVIIAMHHEQDVDKMGALARRMPLTCALTWIGSLSLMGVPFFSGYYSKDMIVEAAFAADSVVGYLAFTLAAAACVLTGVYSFRLLWLVFHRKKRVEGELEPVPWTMKLPAVGLSFGAIFIGFIFTRYMVGDQWQEFWGTSVRVIHAAAMEGANHVPYWVVATPTASVVVALCIAFFWNKYLQMSRVPALHNFLSHAWYFDVLYDKVFVKSGWKFSSILRNLEKTKLDRYIVDGIPKAVYSIWNHLKKLQDGTINHYVLAASSFLVLILFFVFYKV